MDYHILTFDPDRKTVNVIYHMPISAKLTNGAGLSLQAAIVRELGGADNITSQLVGITAEELSALKAGSILEVPYNLRFSSTNLTLEERVNQIKAGFTTVGAQIIAEKQITLSQMGAEGTV